MSGHELNVLYKDEDIIVVVKPPGVPSQADRSGNQDMYSMVCAYAKASSVGLVQRLDRPVGGIMVMSLSAKASKVMTRYVQERKIDKYYMAIVDGNAADSEQIESYIRKVRGNRAIVSQKNVSGAQKGLLTYRCLDRKIINNGTDDVIDFLTSVSGEVHTAVESGRCISLLEVKLHTGRFHQIRAQLAHSRLPIIGDTKYNKAYAEARGWHRIGLYAYRLEFHHPVTDEPMSFRHMNLEEPFDVFADYFEARNSCQ